MKRFSNAVGAVALMTSQMAVPVMAQPAQMSGMAVPMQSVPQPQIQPTRPAPPAPGNYTPPPPRPNPGFGGGNGGIGTGAGTGGAQGGNGIGNGAGWNGGGQQGGNGIGNGAGWNGGNNNPNPGYGYGYGYGGNGRPPGGGNNGGIGNGAGWGGGIVRCESWQFRYAECRADTRGGVRIVRVQGGDCRSGNWGWRSNEIWVNNGCRADFETRRGGGYYPDNNGPSAGAIIGGVAIAAGLVALLAAASKKSTAPAAVAPSAPVPAKIEVDPFMVPSDARASMAVCLAEAAKQLGATGASEIRINSIDQIERGNGGYRYRMKLEAIYPNETRIVPTFCRATGNNLIELTFG